MIKFEDCCGKGVNDLWISGRVVYIVVGWFVNF